MTLTDGPHQADLFAMAGDAPAGAEAVRAMIFNDAEASGARLAALSRQRRTAALMAAFNSVSHRLRALVQDEGGTIDIDYLMIMFLDFLSERMVSSTSVPHEEIVEAIASTAMQMSPDISQANADRTARRVLDLLSNHEGRGKPFVVEHFCPLSGKTLVQEVSYLAFETSPDGWRLTEDGMKVTLRVLDVQEEDGALGYYLLERAIKRKNISEIMARVRSTRTECHRYSALIRVRIRDVMMRLPGSWTDFSEHLDRAMALIEERNQNTLTVQRSIGLLMEEDGTSREHLAQLREAGGEIERVFAAYSSLSATVMKAQDDYADLMAADVGKGRSSLMPDLFRDVLVPYSALPLSAAAAFAEAAGTAFGGVRRPDGILDLARLVDETDVAVDQIGEENEPSQDDAEEEMVVDDRMTVEDHIRIQMRVAAMSRSRASRRLSDLCEEIVQIDGLGARDRIAMILEAATLTVGVDVEPVEAAFGIDGMIRGDDVMLTGGL